MRNKILTTLATVGLFVSFSMAASAASVTASSVSGDVKAAKGGATPAAVSQGDVLGSGMAIHTGRDGRLVGAFDADNSFELMPESIVELKGRNNVTLNLKQGRVVSNLTSWPASRKYKVVTRAGTFEAEGTGFDSAFRVGPSGEFIGGTDVSVGEVSYSTPEVDIPSIVAGGGVSVTRTVGQDSIMLEITAKGNPLVLEVAGSHTFTLAAGATVRIAISLGDKDRFFGLAVTQGSATVGNRTLVPNDGAVYVAGTQVLPNGGASAFMNAVQVESSAYAESQLPGLTPEQLASLQAQQQSGAAAIREVVQGAGLAPVYNRPFVTERPVGLVLSPSGNP